MNNQLTELLTNYGKVRCIWFDGWWDQDQNPNFDCLLKLLSKIRKLLLWLSASLHHIQNVQVTMTE